MHAPASTPANYDEIIAYKLPLRSEQDGGMTVYYGDIESYKASLILRILGRKGEENYCLLNISESSQLKAATAFKALGALME